LTTNVHDFGKTVGEIRDSPFHRIVTDTMKQNIETEHLLNRKKRNYTL